MTVRAGGWGSPSAAGDRPSTQGDIALIEQHFPNAAAGPCPNTCNCSQFGYVAVETVPYEHAAITLMTSAGVVVVEAAGNADARDIRESRFGAGLAQPDRRVGRGSA